MSGVNVGELFNKYKSEQIQAVPAGTYVLEITKANVRGDNAIMPIFKIVEGPMTGQSVMAGQFTLTEKAAGIFFQNLKGCGLTNEFFARGPSLDQIAEALVGRVVQAELTVEAWQGDDRNKLPIGKIKFLRMAGPAGLGVPAPAPAVPAAPLPPAPVAAEAPSAPAPAAEEASAVEAGANGQASLSTPF